MLKQMLMMMKKSPNVHFLLQCDKLYGFNVFVDFQVVGKHQFGKITRVEKIELSKFSTENQLQQCLRTQNAESMKLTNGRLKVHRCQAVGSEFYFQTPEQCIALAFVMQTQFDAHKLHALLMCFHLCQVDQGRTRSQRTCL